MKSIQVFLLTIGCFCIGCAGHISVPHVIHNANTVEEFQGTYSIDSLKIWNCFLWATLSPSEARGFNQYGDNIRLTIINESLIHAELYQKKLLVDVVNIPGKLSNGGFVSNEHHSIEFINGFFITGREQLSLWWADKTKNKVIVRRHYAVGAYLLLFPVFGSAGHTQYEAFLVR